MGKGAARFGGKSGFLPKPREIFKQPYKHVVYQKEKDTGYADGIQHPRGTTRDLIRPPVVTPEERLLRTAHPPKTVYNAESMAKLPAEQQANIKNAELRRQYLAESYKAEVSRLERLEALERRKAEEKAKREQEAREYKQSNAEVYTMPTVEQYLDGPFIRPRTEEETALLKQKRQANRDTMILKEKQDRAVKLVELYNATANFAVTEEKLKELVDSAFSERKLQSVRNVLGVDTNRLGTTPASGMFEKTLEETIVGTVNRGPSLDTVEATLDGFNEAILETAQQTIESRKLELKEMTEEKQRQLQELQEKMLREREES
ncbi:hypothetical protein OGAPHI_007182 [Ogataea philodendri]|uniref:37S ribosomal protein PET123, mitochondrial n=1 Tax=Ogataea philodendri TaxID=1378263 RepID=A0A9P8NV76_9ASCO|nr:uncharacterized protein OGAPHI_007182 [Ogataea philodendri]KAH3659977.1 hypothetical protein OGAPHI_007182 [Ogataea philodendri]